MQNAVSDAIVQALDGWRDWRDSIQALTFNTVYGSPWLQALAGQSLGDATPPRAHPGEAPEHLAYLRQREATRDASVDAGGLYEAVLRALFHVAQARGEADGRHFRRVWCILYERMAGELPDAAAFRDLVRDQALLAWSQPVAAIDAIPHLLAHSSADDIRWGLGAIEELVAQSPSLTPEEDRRRRHVHALFTAALARAGRVATGHKPDRKRRA